MNIIFLSIVLIAVCLAGWQQLLWTPVPAHPSPMEALSKAMVESAAGAVELALGLVRSHDPFPGPHEGGRGRRPAQDHRPPDSTPHAAAFSGRSGRTPGHGRHDSESFSQRHGTGQCRNPLRYPRHAGN